MITTVPPWLRHDPWHHPTPVPHEPVGRADWEAAQSICSLLDAPATRLRRVNHTPDTLELASAESVWVAYDLLAEPRVRDDRRRGARPVPAADAVLDVVDRFAQRWRICWQHNGTRFRVLTAVSHGPGPHQQVPLTRLAGVWWPLALRCGEGGGEIAPATEDPDTADSMPGPLDTCPAWCELAARHADWVPTADGAIRLHRRACVIAGSDRSYTVVISAAEVTGATGITWQGPDVRLADITTPTPEEAAVVTEVLRQLGAAIHDATIPLPPRVQITGSGRRFVGIPARSCTPAGRSNSRSALASQRHR